MEKRTHEVEADTLEEARKELKSKISEGFYLFSENIISDGKSNTFRAVADTIDAAFEDAQKNIPDGIESVEKEIQIPPSQKMVTVEAFDEQSAIAQVHELHITSNEIFKSIKLKTLGRKGFLGIGKKPNIYEAQVFQRAIVAITYKKKAKICAEIGEIPSEGYCQTCGITNSSPDTEKGLHFFCSSNCREMFFNASFLFKIADSTPMYMSPNLSYNDLLDFENVNKRVNNLKVYCWRCHKRTLLKYVYNTPCIKCGENQGIKGFNDVIPLADIQTLKKVISSVEKEMK